MGFINTYTSRYSPHPVFYQGTYAQALNDAKNELRFLVVYLHSESAPETQNFCRFALFSKLFCLKFVMYFFNIVSCKNVTNLLYIPPQKKVMILFVLFTAFGGKYVLFSISDLKQCQWHLNSHMLLKCYYKTAFINK